MRNHYGRPVAVATLFNEDGAPVGEFPLAVLLTREKQGEFEITNKAEVLSYLVLHLGVGA